MKINVIHRKSGESLFKAADSPQGLCFIHERGDHPVYLPLLKAANNVEELIQLLEPFSEKVLVKAEGVEVSDPKDPAAQPNEPTLENPVASEDISARIEPAIKILKDLLSQAEKKKKLRAEAEAHVQALILEQQHAQAIVPMDGQYYVTMDGDGIGNQVARAQFTNDEQKVKEVSARIDNGKNLFVQWAIQYGGSVIEAGGDEGQVRVPSPALEHIEEFRAGYKKQVGATVTVGVGRTISESIQARELGKLRGKNQVVYFDENTEKEINLRLQDKGEESAAKKLSESGVLDKSEKPATKWLPGASVEENLKKQQEYEAQHKPASA
jgi:hypothetical protein